MHVYIKGSWKRERDEKERDQETDIEKESCKIRSLLRAAGADIELFMSLDCDVNSLTVSHVYLTAIDEHAKLHYKRVKVTCTLS